MQPQTVLAGMGYYERVEGLDRFQSPAMVTEPGLRSDGTTRGTEWPSDGLIEDWWPPTTGGNNTGPQETL